VFEIVQSPIQFRIQSTFCITEFEIRLQTRIQKYIIFYRIWNTFKKYIFWIVI